MLELIAEYGGSISAEHGIGQKKRDMLKEIKDGRGTRHDADDQNRADPKGIMNPGKVI